MSTVWLKKLPPTFRLPGATAVTKAEQEKKKPKGKSKYNNTKVKNRFGKFDSEKEWERFQKLNKLQRAGLIKNLRCQVCFVLLPRVKLYGEKRVKPALRYFADFVYEDELGREVIEDAKSDETRKKQDYRIKKHAMKVLLQKDIVEV